MAPFYLVWITVMPLRTLTHYFFVLLLTFRSLFSLKGRIQFSISNKTIRKHKIKAKKYIRKKDVSEETWKQKNALQQNFPFLFVNLFDFRCIILRTFHWFIWFFIVIAGIFTNRQHVINNNIVRARKFKHPSYRWLLMWYIALSTLLSLSKTTQIKLIFGDNYTNNITK